MRAITLVEEHSFRQKSDMKLKFRMNSVIKLTVETFCNGRFFGPVSYVSTIASLYLNIIIFRNQIWETEEYIQNLLVK
jgi:hypothetical protein